MPELDTRYRLTPDGAALVAEHVRRGRIRLTLEGGDRATAPGLGRLRFARDAAGKVTGFRLYGSRVLGLRFEKR